MNFFKNLFVWTGSFVLLLLVAVIICTHVIDPNQFRGILEKQATRHLGTPVKIHGSLSWQWFPKLSLEVKNITIQHTMEPRVTSTLGVLQVYVNPLSVYTQPLRISLTGKNVTIPLDKSKPPLKINAFEANLFLTSQHIRITPLQVYITNTPERFTIHIDKQSIKPLYSVVYKAQNMNLQNLLSTLGYSNKIAGIGTINAELTATGKTHSEFLKTLSGKINVKITDGKIYGIDFIESLKSAHAAVYKLVNLITNNKSAGDNIASLESSLFQPKNTLQTYTNFSSLTATVQIKNGIANNTDFLMTHPEYNLQGAGNFNCLTQFIQYRASMLLTKQVSNEPLSTFLIKTPLVITIYGTPEHLKVRPDLKAYTNQALGHAKETIIPQLLEQGLQKLLNRALQK